MLLFLPLSPPQNKTKQELFSHKFGSGKQSEPFLMDGRASASVVAPYGAHHHVSDERGRTKANMTTNILSIVIIRRC